MRKIQMNHEEITEPVAINKEQARARYSIGLSTLDKVATEAKDIVHIGRRKVYLVSRLDAFFEQLAQE